MLAGILVEVLISYRHGFVFLRTRKTAGTSVEAALAEHAGPEDVVTLKASTQNIRVPLRDWQPRDWARAAIKGRPLRFHTHMAASEVQHYVSLDRFYTFSTDRNPWDLAVSAYQWHQHRVRTGKARPGVQPTNFEDFVMSNRLDGFSSWRIYAIDDHRVAVNRIIRYDQLDEELAEVTDLLGLPRLTLARKKGDIRGDRRPYQEWYTERARERVADVFSREIAYLGWSFD